MPKFGRKSAELREYLCQDLKRLVDEVIKGYDFSIIETIRDKAEQEKAFMFGRSKAHYGQSAHNFHPCFALDVIPYPVPVKQVKGVVVWDDNSPEWDKMINAFKAKADELGIKITCGIDFKSLTDKPHIEIADWKQRVRSI